MHLHSKGIDIKYYKKLKEGHKKQKHAFIIDGAVPPCKLQDWDAKEQIFLPELDVIIYSTWDL